MQEKERMNNQDAEIDEAEELEAGSPVHARPPFILEMVATPEVLMNPAVIPAANAKPAHRRAENPEESPALAEDLITFPICTNGLDEAPPEAPEVQEAPEVRLSAPQHLPCSCAVDADSLPRTFVSSCVVRFAPASPAVSTSVASAGPTYSSSTHHPRPARSPSFAPSASSSHTPSLSINNKMQTRMGKFDILSLFYIEWSARRQ